MEEPHRSVEEIEAINRRAERFFAKRDGNPNRRCAHGKLFTESCADCGYAHPRDRKE